MLARASKATGGPHSCGGVGITTGVGLCFTPEPRRRAAAQAALAPARTQPDVGGVRGDGVSVQTCETGVNDGTLKAPAGIINTKGGFFSTTVSG